MNGTHGGGCCSHDDKRAKQDDREPDQKTQARSAGTSDGCCGGAAGHTQLSAPIELSAEQPHP